DGLAPVAAGLAALDPAPPGVEVAHDVPLQLGGDGDLEPADRLEHDRPRLLERGPERQPAGDLEGHLGAVDRVLLAVGDGDLHVDHREAEHAALLHRLLDALLDGGDERAADRPADDRALELEAAAAGSGSRSMMHTPNWPWPP